MSIAANLASADNFWFNKNVNEDFTDRFSWEDKNGNTAPRVPGHEDRAIIPDDLLAIIRDGETITIDTLRIERSGTTGGELYIEGTGELILENDDLNCGLGTPWPTCSLYDNSVIDGTLLLQTANGGGSGPAGQLTFTVNDHIIAGNGQITSSKNPRAIIVITALD